MKPTTFLQTLRCIRITLTAICSLGLHCCTATESPSRSDGKSRPPNIVVFLSDDQGWGDFGFQGNTNFQTPNLDRLAASGAVCQRFYVCPVCAPTRAEFLTGRYHPRGSAMGVTQGDERLDPDEFTLALRLGQAGYTTGAFGKWHNGSQFAFHPNDRGFDEFYGFCSGHWGDYFSPPLEHNGKKVQGNGFVADDFTDHAIEFIRKNSQKPFFCYVAFNTPHSPMQVPDSFMDRVRDRKLQMKAGEKEDEATTKAAIAMVENIDWNVGRVCELLEALKLQQDTIVVYFNDNGPNSLRWNGGLKGRKGSVDEGGVRSPMIVSWPGRIPRAHRVNQLAGAIDITPTLCELAGILIEDDPEHRFDGISIARHLIDPSAPDISRSLFSQWSGRVAMRQDQYLLDPDGALFHLIDDPTQQIDLAQTEPERTAAMTREIKAWRDQILRLADTNRPFLIGHPSGKSTLLPAQDGKCKGPSVKRSDTAPNCSFFANIRSTDDLVFWDVEPIESGRYSVWLHYTASDSAVGKKFTISIADEYLVATIQQAFDSPLRGEQNDRVPRKSESLMKEFKEIQLGTLNLRERRSNCEFRLLNPIQDPGGIEIQSIEFRKEP